MELIKEYIEGLKKCIAELSTRDIEVVASTIFDAFKKGKFDILLSSEVGGEGLDFQFCRVIINYDLPYNPMRVEQRIGRIDRFGGKGHQDGRQQNLYR